MKTICSFIIIGLLIFCFKEINAQDLIAKYNMVFVPAGTDSFEIQATKPSDDNTFTFYIDCMSLDQGTKHGGIMIKNSQAPFFINCVKTAKEKFIEWGNVAKQNQVTEMDKVIDVGRLKIDGGYFMHYKDWEFDFSIVLTFRFKIIDGTPTLIINTGEMVSSSNEFIKTDGFAFVFQSVNEIDNFMVGLDENLVISHYKNKAEKENLFK